MHILFFIVNKWIFPIAIIRVTDLPLGWKIKLWALTVSVLQEKLLVSSVALLHPSWVSVVVPLHKGSKMTCKKVTLVQEEYNSEFWIAHGIGWHFSVLPELFQVPPAQVPWNHFHHGFFQTMAWNHFHHGFFQPVFPNNGCNYQEDSTSFPTSLYPPYHTWCSQIWQNSIFSCLFLLSLHLQHNTFHELINI